MYLSGKYIIYIYHNALHFNLCQGIQINKPMTKIAMESSTGLFVFGELQRVLNCSDITQ